MMDNITKCTLFSYFILAYGIILQINGFILQDEIMAYVGMMLNMIALICITCLFDSVLIPMQHPHQINTIPPPIHSRHISLAMPAC